jgi:HK97 family phage major capsid protein
MSNDLILEPTVTNPLRPFMTVTQITGLELPKLGFTVADDAFAAKDGETAKEMALDGSGKITFGRFKMALSAEISETVLRGTPLNVEGAVTGGLQSAQAAKELKVMFNTNPSAAEKHMSLYAKTDDAYDIKAVEGDTMLNAIINAFGDLEDAYQDNARCCMRRQDYFAMIRTLSNNSESLYGKKPEDVIGFPVIFCAKATVPVVGDLRFLHENFDMAPLYDTDKDVSTGNRLFVLTHVYDIWPRLKSAFRLAVLTPAAPEGGA